MDGKELVRHGRRVDIDVDLGDGVVKTGLIPTNIGDVGDLDLLIGGRSDVETTSKAFGRVVDGGGRLTLDEALLCVWDVALPELLLLLLMMVVVMHVTASVERHDGRTNECKSPKDVCVCVCVCAEGDGVKNVKMQPTWAVC